MKVARSRDRGRLWARWALDPRWGAREGVWAEWEAGRWTRLEPSPRPPRGAPPECVFDDHLLTPGFLDAHTHLDYSFSSGGLPRAGSFARWLDGLLAARDRLLQARAADPVGIAARAQAAAFEALDGLLADGTTEVWDIASSRLGRWGTAALRRAGVPAIQFVEWIAPHRGEWAQRWRDFSCAAAWGVRRRRLARAGIRPAVSPHAVYTVCEPALAQVARWARRRGVPLAIHLAESPEERQLLIEGRGPLADRLARLPGWDLDRDLPPGRSAIARAADAGLLGPRTLAVHCNLPEPGEAERLARTRVAVVFCPLSHAWFGYPPYPLEAYRRAGVRLALGTDSAASNERLSMRAELRRLADLAPEWEPERLLGCATGALLGEEPPFGGRGTLALGAPARWALWRLAHAPARVAAAELLAALLDPATALTASSAWPTVATGSGRRDAIET